MGKKLQDHIRVALLLQVMDWICVTLLPSTLAYYLWYIGEILLIFHSKIIEPEHIPCWNLFWDPAFDTGSTFAALDREFKHEGVMLKYIQTHANNLFFFFLHFLNEWRWWFSHNLHNMDRNSMLSLMSCIFPSHKDLLDCYWSTADCGVTSNTTLLLKHIQFIESCCR